MALVKVSSKLHKLGRKRWKQKVSPKMVRWRDHSCRGEAKTPSVYAVNIRHDTLKNT